MDRRIYFYVNKQKHNEVFIGMEDTKETSQVQKLGMIVMRDDDTDYIYDIKNLLQESLDKGYQIGFEAGLANF